MKVFTYIKEVFKEFSADNIFKYSASLAYYTVFSIAPLLVIVTSLSAVFFGKVAVQGEVYGELRDLIGSAAALQLQDTIRQIHFTGNNFFASVVSVVVLILSATTIFGEIQDSLNKIWGLKVTKKSGFWKLILTRILSFSLVLSIGLIIVISLVFNTLIAAFGEFIARFLSEYSLYLITILNNGLSFIILAFMFSLMFKILPDAKIHWRDVAVGGAVTAVFFSLGKWAISFYLSKSNFTTIYGAAGSIIIFMVWVYYSSIILYLGAEFTKVYANLYGRKIVPNEFAKFVRIEEKTVSSSQLKNKDLS